MPTPKSALGHRALAGGSIAMRRFLSPPVFAGEEQSRRARVFHVVAWGTILLATASLVAVMLMQPSLTRRATTSLLVVDLLGLSMLELNRRGWTRLASALLVGGLVALVSVNALIGGESAARAFRRSTPSP